MLEIGEIAKATRDVVKQLTDVIGLIEKNLASYDRIKSRFRRRRIADRLQEILQEMLPLKRDNAYTLWEMTENIRRRAAAVQDDSFLESDYVKRELDAFMFSDDLHNYLKSLLAMRDLIDQYKGDIVSIDYKLYEDIEDALSGRIDVLQMLLDHDQSGISLEKLKELHDSYCSLVAGLTQL